MEVQPVTVGQLIVKLQLHPQDVEVEMVPRGSVGFKIVDVQYHEYGAVHELIRCVELS